MIGSRLCLCVTFCLLLSACSESLLPGVQAWYDRDNWHRRFVQQKIVVLAKKKISQEPILAKNTRIDLAAFHDVVLVAGQAKTASLKHRVETIVRSLAENKKVFNQITIEPPVSSWRHTQDVWISTKYLTKLHLSSKVTAKNIKVLTENGVLYLIGTVRESQGEEAIKIARNTHGVKKVVTLMRYLYEKPRSAKGMTS